ncbi:MAG: M23 family metallopeptidase [Cyanobacteria bacterium]|nr:M23 family metallopeptidase [Cyanobacteria bacterium CG_2015-16_32_12]NCO79283.1 M23 family metallopeptidase [Cyanobacteria bacterium CG_2015-22_32_23]NCQ05390.1 M23 family metallopeptidase [Cyanobacteria bacterium CG_2015-09_32_10]NCQ41647.1 M23 family metallopeptidase [Cyanobacteria bacterium CG_2015-04_32_10]NCS85596.1 M23 family metallopeptidase [Cyanobacteria bacterium CG_2015-02_32_10]
MFNLITAVTRLTKKSLNPKNLSFSSGLLISILTVIITNSLILVKPKLVQGQTIPVTASWRQASFPVENFQAYTSGFGYRVHPVTGSRQFHQGLDLAAPLGSYVRSWWSGQVVGLSDHTACGTMIKIQSGNWTHIYCHLMGTVENTDRGTVLVDRSGGVVLWQGQNVPAGARIGRVGMTGRTTGPHLHWGLMYNGNYVNPADVLRQMFAQKI